MTIERFFFVGHVYDQSSIDDLRLSIFEACKGTEWVPLYADERIIDGHILTDKIIPDIQLSEFCLFEISDKTHPNVFIEYGIAKGFYKPCILLSRDNSQPPSDLGGYDRLVYSSYVQLKDKLKTFLKAPPLSLSINQSTKSSGYLVGHAKIFISVSDINVTINEAINKARFNVSSLGLCGNPLEASVGIWELIKLKSDSGCNFRFLHMDPKSRLLKMRSCEEDGISDSRRLILQSESTLGSLKKLKSEVSNPAKIQYGIYDRIPSLALIHTDNTVYVGPYLFRQRGIESPWFMIQRDVHPIVFIQYIQMFERLWDDVYTKKF